MISVASKTPFAVFFRCFFPHPAENVKIFAAGCGNFPIVVDYFRSLNRLDRGADDRMARGSWEFARREGVVRRRGRARPGACHLGFGGIPR